MDHSVQKKKILFLYTELPSYFLACVRKFAELFDAEAHIVKWPVHSDAPFVFPEAKNIFYYERKNYSRDELLALVNSLKPDVIFCSGWRDEAYLAVCERYRKRISVVLAFDHQWRGTLKQRLRVLFGKGYLNKLFSHVWVPGQIQAEYAKRLGFQTPQILFGVYSADVDFFCQKNSNGREGSFPKRFIFLGRHVEVKGVLELWRAFTELQEELGNSWELWCIGAGALETLIPKNDRIKCLGFLQPEEMKVYLKESGVLVLPSHFEPWGVAVHECAAAGMPLICSDQVGAVSVFLRDGYNGYVHRAKDKKSLKNAMRKVMAHDDQTLFQMGERSAELAKQITAEMWAKTLWQIANGSAN